MTTRDHSTRWQRGAHQWRGLVMVQGVAPVIAGLVIGVAGAIGLSRFVAGFLGA